MTSGEKMVWAAVYAQKRERALRDPPKDVLLGPNNLERRGEWELGEVAAAVESACYAVHHMRDVLPRITDEYGGDAEKMLKEMLGDD